MTTQSERAFVTFERGRLRDEMLAHFRNGLRKLVNSDTGDFFTEEEIRQATQEGSREYLRLDAVDLGLQSSQQRARFTAQQTNPALSASRWLREFHCKQWGVDPLPASSGSGPVTWKATPGSIFVGSTTLGDAAVMTATDPRGNVFQVATTTTTPANGQASLTFVAVKGGKGTNPTNLTIFAKGANAPPGSEPTGTVTADFKGGFDDESDQELVDRLLDRIRRKPASGNRAQFRAWGRGVTTAVEKAFVYACVFGTGSVGVVIVGKRGTGSGPLARLPSDATLVSVRNFLTPPGSSVVPARPHVLVHKWVSEPVSLSMRLSMRTGTTGGWVDSQPWPSPVGSTTTDNAFCRVVSVADSTHFHVSSGTAPANGTVPGLMVWRPLTSRFEKLNVQSVSFISGTEYAVVLSGPPDGAVLVLNDVICPYTPLLDAIAKGAESYFDSLGPGEMVDLATSPRARRAFRWPEPGDESPYEAGQTIVTSLVDALGGSLSGSQLSYITHTKPALPTDLSQEGPHMLTLNEFGAYAS